MAQSTTEGIIQAEKGKNLSPHSLHLRLRVLEIVTLVSLLLNLGLWYFAGNINSKVDNKVDAGSAMSTPVR